MPAALIAKLTSGFSVGARPHVSASEIGPPTLCGPITQATAKNYLWLLQTDAVHDVLEIAPDSVATCKMTPRRIRGAARVEISVGPSRAV